jgi:glutamate synthase (NADPH) small chain
MGELGGFLRERRTPSNERDPRERIRDYREILLPVAREHDEIEGARCMECGIPFCHSACPLGNRIPDWNDLVYRRHWWDAYDALDTTNPFPELTGRICPAPCERGAC